jgi:hypothetical protein
MKEFLIDFLEGYAEKFDYTAVIEDDVGIIRTQYGDIGFKQSGDEELKILKVKPLDDDNDDQISSLIKIKKHFTGALQKAIARHQEENPANDPEMGTKPAKEPGNAVEVSPTEEETDNLGRPYPKLSDKPPAHFTKPEKVKGGKKTVDNKITPPPVPEPPLPAEDIPGSKAYGDKQRAIKNSVNTLGNSAATMEKVAKAEIGGKKKTDPPDEPIEAKAATLDDIMDGKVDVQKKPVASQPVAAKMVPAQKPAAPVTSSIPSGELVMEDAAREMAFIKMLISSPAGGGKTLSALLVARGLCDSWDQICIIDTENKSGVLYVGTEVDGTKIGTYKTITLRAPYTVERYTRAMEMAEKAGIKVLIIDSLSHAWTAEGGLLDLHTKITAASRTGNSYTAWKDVTPLHSKLIEKIQNCSMHVILTGRSKMEHAMEKTDKGMAPKKVGMGIIFRDGIEYEVSIAFEIDQASHVAQVTKDRTRAFADSPYVTLNVKDGQRIKEWLESAKIEE